MRLKNKIAVVTGGSDGIGYHISLQLAKQGCELAILGRNFERLAKVEADCLQAGSPKAKSYACDVCDSIQLEKTAAAILSEFDSVDALINNAGIWHKTGPLDQIPDDLLVSTVQTNLTGLMQFTRHLLPALRTREESAIINVVSKSGVVAQAGQSVYTATKYGVRGFTEVLKEDEKDTGIRVAGVYQSGTNTKMFAKAGEDVPNHIFTEPEDLANVVVFMLSQPPKIWLHDVRVEL